MAEAEDAPSEPHTVFSLLAEYTMEEATDLVTVQLSPEGEAFFHAWVPRQAVHTETVRGWGPEEGP